MNEKGEGGITALVVLGLIIFGCIWGYNHFIKADKWSLMYENNLGVVVRAGDYSSRENCSIALKQAQASPIKYSRPECGSNCKPPTTLNGPYICDETFEL